MAAYPDLDWPAVGRTFVEDTLQLTYNPFTTQIEVCFLSLSLSLPLSPSLSLSLLFCLSL